MRWKEKDFYRWRRWFAWYPVKIGDTWAWLEIIEWRFRIGQYDQANYIGADKRLLPRKGDGMSPGERAQLS